MIKSSGPCYYNFHRNFLSNFHQLDLKGQILTSQGMVGIENNFLFCYLGHRCNHRWLTFTTLRLQLHANFELNTLGELIMANFEDTLFNEWAISLFGRNFHGLDIPNGHIGHGLIKAIDNLTCTDHELERLTLARRIKNRPVVEGTRIMNLDRLFTCSFRHISSCFVPKKFALD